MARTKKYTYLLSGRYKRLGDFEIWSCRGLVVLIPENSGICLDQHSMYAQNNLSSNLQYCFLTSYDLFEDATARFYFFSKLLKCFIEETRGPAPKQNS